MTSVATDRLARVRTQAWVGTQEPTEEGFIEPSHGDRAGPWVKPNGGLWTSTFDGPYGSAWCQWCIGEQFYGRGISDQAVDNEYVRFNVRAHIYKLTPRADARIYEIGSLDDLQRLVDTYGAPSVWSNLDVAHSSMPREYPDWLAMAADFDGVRLTEGGQWATRLSMPANLYGWDCESTLWLRWCFDSVEDIGVIRLKVRDPWWDYYSVKANAYLLSRYSEGQREFDNHRRKERRAERNRYYV